MIESRIGFDDLEQVTTNEEWNDAKIQDEIEKDENENKKDENENEKDENDDNENDDNEKDEHEDDLTEILPSPKHQTSLLKGRNRKSINHEFDVQNSYFLCNVGIDAMFFVS